MYPFPHLRLRLLCFVLLCVFSAGAQDTLSLRVMFYNCENLMDTVNDPLTADDDFTPRGSHHWTSFRLWEKLNRLTRVILAAGEGRPPALIGLAEIENDSVLSQWLRNRAMWKMGYRYLITSGIDTRGIDVGLFYQPHRFRLLGWEALRIPMPEGTRPTRDLLHAWGRIPSGDTLDVVVCHLPSRLGGARASRPARRAAHLRLRALMDSLLYIRRQPALIVMGDMNDYPVTKTFLRDLRLGDPERDAINTDSVYDLMIPLHRRLQRGKLPTGSHKYAGDWGFLDHFLVNGLLLDTASVPYLRNPRPFSLPFMLTEDRTHFGMRPQRSYYGFSWEGGYSDHLPVLVDLVCSMSFQASEP